jgi:hypothetical protein
MNRCLIPTANALGTWFAVSASRAQRQQDVQEQQQQLRPQQTDTTQQSLSTTNGGRTTGRARQIFHEQIYHHRQQMRAHAEIAAMKLGLVPGLKRTRRVLTPTGSSPSTPSLQAQDAIAAAVAITGAHNLRPTLPSPLLPMALQQSEQTVWGLPRAV